MEPVIITTPLKLTNEIQEEAHKLSIELGVPYIKREKSSLELIKNHYKVDRILIVGRNKITLTDGRQEYFYHPSMAKVRIKDLISGKPDQMVNAMRLQSGDRVLDCTLGLGTDALVSSFITGDRGEVIGLETIKLIAVVTDHGLHNYKDNNSILNDAMRRIKVANVDYRQCLKELSDKSFDIVYFDPMFRRPGLKSSAINAFRDLADPSSLEKDAIKEALRVARKRVVMKESSQSREFLRLGFSNIVGGKYSPVAYGVIEC